MADPLSISASIAGLISLADIVFLRLTKYIKSVKDAETEINDLCKEVNLLGGAVSMLSRLARGHEMEAEPFNRNFRMYHIEGCAFILNEITQKTKKYDANPRGKLLKLMWPYTSSKTKELLANLSRHKENINLALTANSMEALLRCLATEEDRAKAIAEVQADVQKTREIVVRIEEDSRRKEILQFFLPYNPQPNYEMSVKLRHPMTGTWLERLPSFQTWLSSPCSRLWLSGIPGAGKTVLAGSIIGQALVRSSDTVAVGFFFCDYKNESTQTPASVLGALAHQLARQNEEAYLLLEVYYSELHRERSLPRSPDPDDLVKVILAMTQAFKQVYLVVDGLDECQDSTDQVVGALCNIAEYSEEISMALLSRHEDNIRDRLQDPEASFIHIQIAAHKEDITEYVSSEIQQRMRNKRLHLEDLSLQGEILDGLVDGANGMFRWVACQLDHLESCISDEQCREALRSLPPTLPKTYLRILERIPKAQKSTAQLTLDLIAFADPKLSIAQLREALSVPMNSSLLKASGVVREDAITRICSSLVRMSSYGDYLEFAHFSVKEFLTSEFLELSEFQMFSISRTRCNRVLATLCVKFLQLQNFNHLPTPTEDGLLIIEKTALDHPLYEYAAHNWICFARGEWDDPALLASAKGLFDPSKTASFIHWAVVLAIKFRGGTQPRDMEQWEKIKVIQEFSDESFRPLHFAATLCLPEISSALLEDIDHQEAETLFEGIFEYAVDSLNGALRFWSPFRANAYADIPRHLKHHVGTPVIQTLYILQTIKVLIGYFGRAPQNIIGFSLHCWARTNDFSVVQLLIEEGKTLAPSDLERFAEETQKLIGDQPQLWKTDQLHTICSLCKCLSDRIDESALYFEFCRLVWEFVYNVNDDMAYINDWEIDSRICEDQHTRESVAISACEGVWPDVLGRAVSNKRVEVSSITDPETGNGLLHTLAIGDTEPEDYRHPYRASSLINKTLDILLGGGCKLSSRNNEGHTPLSLALQQHKSLFAETVLKRPEIEYGAWESPVPILCLVAQLHVGSDNVLDQLLGLGFRPSPVDCNTRTPLHCLHAEIELASIIRFDELYPGARQLRVDGKMPWEHYLDATNFDPPSADALDYLVQPLLCHSEPREAAKVWEYYTSNLARSSFQTANQAYNQIITSLLKSGALGCYEKTHSQSGLLSIVPILSAFLKKQGPTRQFPIVDSTMCLLIQTTEYWATFQETPAAIQMLKLSATFALDAAVTLLLERGIRVHRRHDGVSALEHVFHLPAVDGESIARVQRFLTHADSASMNQTNPTSGLGLIHSWNNMDEEQPRSKILELTIESGASPNLRTTLASRFSGLVYHLNEKNFHLASVLLDRGADPLIPCLNGWTAVHMASARDATSFLASLLSPKGSVWTVDWDSGCGCYLQGEGFIDDTRALHLAATGSSEALEMLLEQMPETSLEATAGKGFTAMHFAATTGRINCINTLASRGANVNARSADGQLALHIAVEKFNLGLVERLLELGSEITARSDGMTPLLLAYEGNCQPIIDRLKAHAAESPVAESVSDGIPAPAIAKAVFSSVLAGNLSACQSLLSQQLSVDIDLSEGGTGGFTPLGIAIRHGMLQIAKWLLEEGANANCHNGDGTSAIQDMIKDGSLNPILQYMLDKYLSDGGSILSEPSSLVHSAVSADNNEGLRIFLDHLQANRKEYGERAGVASLATVRTSVNRAHKGWSSLRLAIDRANETAVGLLLDNGADLEVMDSFNRTPLIYATQTLSDVDASSIVPLLVQAGGNLNRRDDEGMDPLIGACQRPSPDLILYLMDLGVSLHTTDHVGSNGLHYLLHKSDRVDSGSRIPSIFLRFTRMLVDPYEANNFGWSALHFSMFRKSMMSLILNGEFQNLDLAPMPWSTNLRCPAFPEAACLTSGFRLYRRKMSFERFRKLLNTEPVDGWSPLCRAAALGNIEVMKNLLLMGCRIDFEGCPEGSALMAASRAGILDSVVFLTRHGASISFQGRKRHWSAVETSAKSTRILQWLLVDRFTDQRKLEGAPGQFNMPPEHFKKWSGITKAEMIIPGEWERRPIESSREYWSFLEGMKQGFHGKVIPPHRGSKTRRRSNLIPSETVRVAAGGYSCTDANGRRLGLSTEVEDFLFRFQLGMCFRQ